MGDLVRKGNARNQVNRSGEAHGMSTLTEAQVIEIRERYAAGESAVPIADEFGVSMPTVTHIVMGQTWKLAGGPVQGVDYLRHRSGWQRKNISIEWLD